MKANANGNRDQYIFLMRHCMLIDSLPRLERKWQQLCCLSLSMVSIYEECTYTVVRKLMVSELSCGNGFPKLSEFSKHTIP